MDPKQLQIEYTSQFKRDLKKAKKQNKDLLKLKKVVELLQQNCDVPKKYRDHALIGNWSGFRELHIESDWLLIYEILVGEAVLILVRLGSHAELFR